MTLRDQVEREQIANDLKTNLMVVASAGAGKTYALVQRMVNCVITGHADVDQLVAITFTRKAAGELRARFYHELREFHDSENPLYRERTQLALSKIDQCFIGTIHSFCAQLLRERPYEIGLPPEFSELEGQEEMVMQRNAWDRFVQGTYFNEDSRLVQFDDLGLGTDDLYEFFSKCCQFTDIALRV